jgi:hypothetical protein
VPSQASVTGDTSKCPTSNWRRARNSRRHQRRIHQSHPILTNQASATFYRLEGQNDDAIPGRVAFIRNVIRDYFATAGARLQEGRSFSPSDQKSGSPVAIVNEPFANKHFAGRSPLGQKFQFGNLGNNGHWYTIVGVVKSIRESGVLEEARPAVYRVHEQCAQVGDLHGGIVVRTAVDPASIVSAVRQAIWSIDRNQPVAHIRTLEEIISGSYRRLRKARPY